MNYLYRRSSNFGFYFFKMDVLKNFETNWQQKFNHISIKSTQFIMAVSGGVDSVVLLDLITKMGFDCIVAHCNFQLRGDESWRDENFVKSLETVYNKKVVTKHFDTQQFAVQNKLSIQEAARKLRYNWFNELINDNNLSQLIGKRYLLTAHHADDNIETLLINFFRGTGIRGLTAIPEFDKENKIIRPLLFAKRADIVAYAKENKLSWVEDSSNSLDKYTRNYIRHHLIPSAKEIFKDVEINLLKNIHRFNEIEILYQQAIDFQKKKLIKQIGEELHIAILQLQKTKPIETIVWEIIKLYSFMPSQIDEVIKLFKAQNGSYIQSATHKIFKNRAWLIIAPLVSDSNSNILIEKEQKKVFFAERVLVLETFAAKDFKINPSPNIALLNANAIEFPLLLRKWKQGDYFYPLGMKKKKKLSKFFIDQKLSLTEKEKVWVIESNKRIVWVIGLRIDDRFKLLPLTSNVLKIEVNG